MPDRASIFAHRCQIAWLDLVATGQDKEAVVWGEIVEAIFDADPRRALVIAEANSFPPRVLSAIRDAFELT